MNSSDPSFSKASFWIAGAISLVAALFICFWNGNTPSIRPGDEALHVTVTQGMLYRGIEFVPQNEGRPYFNKPPLKMWASLLPLTLLGESNFSYRLLDGLAGVGTTLLTFLMAVVLFRSPLMGVVAALLLLGCRAYIFEHTVRAAVQDSALVFLSTAALFAGWCASRSTRGAWWGVLCGVLIGCGILVKHVAGVLPLVVLALFILSTEGLRVFRTTWLWIAAGTAGLVAASYYAPVFLSEPAAWRTLVGVEVVERARDGFHNRTKSFFYFDQLLRGGAAVPPWLMVCGSLWAVYRWARLRERELLFLLIAGILPILLYSIPPSRLIWYIAPTFPAFALLCAWAVHEAARFMKQGAVLKRVLAGLFVLAGIASAGEHLWFVSKRVAAGGDRIELDWLTEALSARPLRATDPREVVFYRGFPPGPFERVYLRMLAQGHGSRERTLAPLQHKIEQRKIRFVIAPIKFFGDLSSAGGIVGYRFIRPSKPVPRWMLRQEWYVLLAYDRRDLIPALTSVERAVELQKAADGWSGTIEGDYATDALGAELSIPGCAPDQVQVRINEFDVPSEQWVAETVVSVNAGVLRPGRNVVTLSGSCTNDLTRAVSLRSKLQR